MQDMQSRILAHLNVLAVEIGERPAGSPAHHRAEAYIRGVLQSAGLSLDEVRLDFPDWSLVDAALSLNGTALALDVNPFSPGCEVTAPLLPLSTLPELEAADLRGRIALLYGELSKSPIFPINFEPVQFERDQAINRLLIEKSPAAVLAVNLHPWRRVHIFEDEDFTLPSATVNVEVGRAVLAHPAATVHLRINTLRRPSHVATLIGRTSGEHSQRIVLCAHYDTKIGTPGAFDNGGGMATVLALAETLPQLGLPIGLEFIAFADEEYGAHTDGAYVRRFGADFERILCAINLDGIGLLPENNTVTALAQSEAFEQVLHQVRARHPQVVWADPWVQSNHSTFAMRGVPSVPLTSVSWERAHQSDDSIDWVNPARLAEAAALVTDLICAVQAQPAAWFRAS